MIDGLATESHFADHIVAVMSALPEGVRGSFMTPNSPTADRARTFGVEAERPRGSDDPVLVASYGDLCRAARLGRRRIAIMEHGAGQSYGGRSIQYGSYAGGSGRGPASLFLHPGEHPANRDRKAYPKARVDVVGSPFLDSLPRREGAPGRVVAFTFHFNAAICPETRSGYPAFFPALAKLAGRYKLLGHGHPRMWAEGGQRLTDRYLAVGIEPVKDFREICRRADVLVADNTSAMFAFAATGRPVVVLNAPWYDRRVNHGLRFWEASEVGVNCNRPEELDAAIAEALRNRPDQKAKREAALDLVYAYREGASQRAADALMDWAA